MNHHRDCHQHCHLSDGPFYQCCCACVYHLPVNHHCATSPDLRRERGACCCGEQKGWACVPPAEAWGAAVVYDNWPEHSIGCEMFRPQTQGD